MNFAAGRPQGGHRTSAASDEAFRPSHRRAAWVTAARGALNTRHRQKTLAMVIGS